MAKRTVRFGNELYPAPVALITAIDADGKSNIVAVAWAANICSDPPYVAIALDPSRFSNVLMRRSGEFVVNVPDVSLIEAVDRCGNVSGQKVNKFELAGLTPAKAEKVAAPLIAECPINLECKLKTVMPVATYDLFIAEVVAVHANEEIIAQNGKIDYNHVDLLAYVAGHYRSVGGQIQKLGFTTGKE